MPPIRPVCLSGLALAALSGCARDTPQPQTTQIIVQQPAQAAALVAPGPPPPPHAELVPPPDPGMGPVVWQPGHWRYTGMPGNDWAWQSGGYVPPPPGQTTWIPGQWAMQPGGGWAWIEGHWTYTQLTREPENPSG